MADTIRIILSQWTYAHHCPLPVSRWHVLRTNVNGENDTSGSLLWLLLARRRFQAVFNVSKQGALLNTGIQLVVVRVGNQRDNEIFDGLVAVIFVVNVTIVWAIRSRCFFDATKDLNLNQTFGF
jgi:hypothetical protein